MTDRSVPEFGTKLKRAREQKAISLREIAIATKISVTALEALERNDISRLPGGIFSRGIVRAYAIEVGLDPEQTVRDFIEQFPTDSVTAGSPHVPTEDHTAIESDRRSAQTVVTLASISLPVAIAILYFTLGGASGAPEGGDTGHADRPAASTPEVPAAPAAPHVPEAAPAVGVTPAAEVDEAPAIENPIVLTVTSSGGAWVDLTVDGTRVFSRMLQPGEQTTARAGTSIVLAVGDAGAVTFTIDGQPGIRLGAAGQARTIRITRETIADFVAVRQ